MIRATLTPAAVAVLLVILTSGFGPGQLIRAQQPPAASEPPAPSRQVVGPAAPSNASPVLAAVAHQFTTMTAARYQHQDVENASAGPPLLLADGSYALLVYDSTATPHGPADTRRSDSRNEVGPNGLPSGLGMGTIHLIPDGSTGAPVAVAWTVGTAPTTAPIGIGRALQ